MPPAPPYRLRCERLDEPVGVDTASPRLSWLVAGQARGDRPTAWQVLVSSAPELLAGGMGDLWDSGRIDADAPPGVEYGGEPLRSCARCHWKVRWWDREGRESPWSE